MYLKIALCAQIWSVVSIANLHHDFGLAEGIEVHMYTHVDVST